MHIAIAADGKSLVSSVSNEFISCKYLLIVDMDNTQINEIENPGESTGETLARKVVDYNCEAVITGRLTPVAFDIIADEDITRYDGYGYSAEDALALMERNGLKFIKNVDGTDECDTKHTANSCESHEDK
jgi:predicted Fe-Mo cluster-binding NifX family protein